MKSVPDFEIWMGSSDKKITVPAFSAIIITTWLSNE